MATITSVGSGNWSTAGTWDSGVPVDGDDVIISAGHTVTFDADQSAFTTGVKITITGTLNHALTGGPYTMFIKTGASVTGAGTWNIGTSGTPIPFAVKHTITGADGWYISGASGLTMTVYGAEPTTKYVRLSNAKGVGDTVLEVDTDVTGDIWADGDIIRINNVNKDVQSEERVIAAAGIAAGSITITAGLTAEKLAGSYVCLMTRNIKIVGVGTAYTCNGIASGKLTVGGGQWTTANYRSFRSCHNMTIAGGTFYGNIPLYANNAVTVSGGVFSGNTYAVQLGTAMYVTGGVFSGNSGGIYAITGLEISGGVFVGNTNAIISCPGSYVSGGTFYGNTNGLIGLVGFTASGGTITGNTSGLNSVSGDISSLSLSDNTQDINTSIVTAYNCLFGSATENTGYTSVAKQAHSESFDHDQVAGAYKAWTKGGVTTKQAVTYPTGFTNSMQTVLESATSEGYWQKEISVGAGQSVNITSYLRKDSSMTYLPRVIMFLKNTTDPFAGGTGLHTFTMTDSVDTWEDDTYTYSNNTSEDTVLVIRTQGKNATGNLFSYLDIEVINVDLTSVLALLNTIDGKADTINTNVDSILADTGTDGVKIADTQGAITWGQQKIIANVAGEGALDIRNSHATGTGLFNSGYVAQYNDGVSAGVVNEGGFVGVVNNGEANVIGFDSAIATASELQTVDDIVDAIKAQTDKIPATPASAGEYTTNIGAIKAKTDNLPASPASAGEYTSALTAIQNDLDNPSQYKADVSGLATSAELAQTEADIIAAMPDETVIPDGIAMETSVQAIKAKTDNLPATPASAGEYTAAIAAIPTAPLLAANYTAPDNASIATIKAKTNLIPANPAVADEYDAALAAIQADLDNPNQYKADVSGLATTAHVQEVGDKVDAIDTDTVMSFMIDGFTFEQIIQIMASVLAGKLTRFGDTLTFRDLADTVNRVIAETDANKQRADMTYSV